MNPQEIVAAAAADPAFKSQLEDDPIAMLSKMPLQTDVWIYRIVVICLGLISIGALVGDMTLAAYGKIIPEGAIALGSTALGAIGALLAPSPVRH